MFHPKELDSDDVPITEVIPVLEAAIKSPSYRNTVSFRSLENFAVFHKKLK